MASGTPSQAEAEPEQTSTPEELDDLLRAGVEAAERGEGIDLTSEEAEHYYGTGDGNRPRTGAL